MIQGMYINDKTIKSLGRTSDVGIELERSTRDNASSQRLRSTERNEEGHVKISSPTNL